MLRTLLPMALVAVQFFAGQGLFAADCEDGLTTAIAKVTKRALEQGQITDAEIKELVDASAPRDPLRHRTPVSANSSLAKFYAASIAQHVSDATWNSARAELRAILASRLASYTTAAVAKDETKTIVAPQLESKHQLPRTHGLSWIGDPAGNQYFALENGTDHYEVRNMLKDSVTEFPMLSGATGILGGLGSDKTGRPQFKSIERTGNLRSLSFWLNRDQFVMDTVDLETKQPTSQKFSLKRAEGLIRFYPARNGGIDLIARGNTLTTLTRRPLDFILPEGAKLGPAIRNVHGTPVILFTRNRGAERYLVTFRDGKWIQLNSQPIVCVPSPSARIKYARPIPQGEVFALNDGRFVAVCGKSPSSVTFYHPFSKEPGRTTEISSANEIAGLDTVEMPDGTVMLFVQRLGPLGYVVDVYAPEMHDTILSTLPHAISFKGFERGGTLYLAAIGYDHAIRIYEALSSDTPLAQVHVERYIDDIREGADGQRYLIVHYGDHLIEVYSLFHE